MEKFPDPDRVPQPIDPRSLNIYSLDDVALINSRKRQAMRRVRGYKPRLKHPLRGLLK